MHIVSISTGKPEPNGLLENMFRKCFIFRKHGWLGKGKRVICPSCVVRKIRKTYPSPNGEYTGFKPNID